ncbi:MAG: metallophosphoesterase [Bacteroidota bacterium]
MRRLLQKIFRPFFVWLAHKFSADPKRELVFKSLSKLYRAISDNKSRKGIVIPIDITKDSFIIFSDQHKGNKDHADDFKNNEANYIAALNYYFKERYRFINLGDGEELWKYPATEVIKNYPDALKAEANFDFLNKYYRTFGNHDLLWKNKLDVTLLLKDIFKMPLPVYEGLILRGMLNKRFSIFLTHGHQGDKMSDNNALSTWAVAHLWAPIQRYLQVNVNTPANDFYLRDKHNKLMYDWSSHKNDTILITGHTHKPVFASGKYNKNFDYSISDNESVKPSYFNTGCCCYNDGDITGIEIDKGDIRLVKWYTEHNEVKKMILEEKKLEEIFKTL